MTTRGEAHLELNAFRRKHDCALVISGDSLEVNSWVSVCESHLLICPYETLTSVWCMIISQPLKYLWKWSLWLESLSKPQKKLNCNVIWAVEDSQLKSVICGGLSCSPVRFFQVCLKYYEYEFMELACQCPAVVCCRCTPTQKAQIVRLLQERTGKLTCAVGEF